MAVRMWQLGVVCVLALLCVAGVRGDLRTSMQMMGPPGGAGGMPPRFTVAFKDTATQEDVDAVVAKAKAVNPENSEEGVLQIIKIFSMRGVSLRCGAGDVAAFEAMSGVDFVEEDAPRHLMGPNNGMPGMPGPSMR